MKQFLITIAGVFIALALIVVAVPLGLLAWAASVTRPPPVAERTVLVLDLRGKLPDQASQSPLADLGGKSLSVMSIEEGLRQAAKDDRVKGLFVRLPEGGMAPAAADELRLAFLRFRAAGTFALYVRGLHEYDYSDVAV